MKFCSLFGSTNQANRLYSTGILGCVAFASVLLAAHHARGVVVLSDGFGDADINNNGTPFEDVDTNVGPTAPLGLPDTYVPGRLEDINGDGPANPEVTSVLDANDTGIRWLQMRGFTGGTTGSSPNAGTGESKPTIRIVDDTQGVMQETMAAGLNIPAIDSGYAMSWESRGGGSSAAGFFDQTIELGPEVGDEVKVSFDFRLWRDAPNANASLEPLAGEFRFGLFQDTDNQLGMTNPFAGRQEDLNGDGFVDDVPAIWGQEEGFFEGDLVGDKGLGDEVGANGDNGWSASVFMGNSFLPNGGGSRIREELNTERILQGADAHTIAAPEDIDPDPFNEEFDFVTLDNDKVYNLSLSLVRATEVTPGDTITATLIVTDVAAMTSWTLSGTEMLDDHTSGGIPIPGTGGIQSDSWDYFAMRNATSGSSEYDFIMDNFMVEIIGSNEPEEGIAGDANGDGKVDILDLDILSGNFGTMGGATVATGDFNGDGNVDILDLDILSGNFGAMASSSTAIPEPSTVLFLGIASTSLMRRVRRSA